MISSTSCSFRGHRFNSQHLYGCSQPLVTPVSGHLMLSAGLFGNTHFFAQTFRIIAFRAVWFFPGIMILTQTPAYSVASQCQRLNQQRIICNLRTSTFFMWGLKTSISCPVPPLSKWRVSKKALSSKPNQTTTATKKKTIKNPKQ